MNPPTMAGWNLALRFALELTALAGLASGAWSLASGDLRCISAIAVSLGAATVWGVFNVPDDPSRLGGAPVRVAGWMRLAVELVVLGAGVAGLVIAGQALVAALMAVLVVVQYATAWPRVAGLVRT